MKYAIGTICEHDRRMFKIIPGDDGYYHLKEWIEEHEEFNIFARKFYKRPAYWKPIASFKTEKEARKRVEHIRQPSVQL